MLANADNVMWISCGIRSIINILVQVITSASLMMTLPIAVIVAFSVRAVEAALMAANAWHVIQDIGSITVFVSPDHGIVQIGD